MRPLTSSKSGKLTGTIRVPGDKSISHRALMLGAITVGETMISGLLEGEDVLHTAEAMRKLGAKIEKGGDGLWRIHGVGIGGLAQPKSTLEMGNSGTSTRLLMGLVGGHNISATFTGDASLSKRPMKRVMTPLELMGVKFESTEGGRLPLTLHGPQDALSIEYKLPVASAQVKSAIILAGLNARGITTVIEATPTRDHTENMLRHFGLAVKTEKLGGGAIAISVTGQQEMQPCAVDVPGDPSSAAFPVVAALLQQGSDIRIERVCIGERRNGIYLTLQEMGADVKFEHQRVEAGEQVADIVVTSNGKLKGVNVPTARVPSMIDEFPVLAMAAACADGTTKMTGLEELRVKESDRLLMIAEGLKSCGVKLEMGEDSLTIHGNGKPPKGGAKIATALDHRIAMSFLVLGSVTDEPITIDDSAPIKTSFPNFEILMNDLGMEIG
ncbi:MAG: 3-phosphoshikimate 1-carboxyvinyltransferase [Alphaproteobacteria bacterium]|jgi:3-phosphoshikimate 1-carboxyvinyltransferase|nr:3-phosphoshikimate 1-carboxyvinyltransferase [Alphaproteobacteria bacterium]